MSSPFLERPESDWIASNALAFALFDGYPVSPGHALIIPRRLVPTWFDASREEQRALMELVEVVKARLDRDYRPDGYNVGINVGEAGGQTVWHLHVHLIPRYRGDMDDPRGGVRHVIPWKGNYKRAPLTRLATGGDDPFKAHLEPLFGEACAIDIIAAFVQDTGLLQLQRHLLDACERGARVRILTGDYLDITAPDALRRLLDWTGRGLEARVFETRGGQAFHPKAWRFDMPHRGVAFVGSSNISASALGRGIEWNLRLDRDEDGEGWDQLVTSFEALWRAARPLDMDWIEAYERRTRAPVVEPALGEREPPFVPPTPHAIQLEALSALSRSRAERRGRALVVLATGLGKTWLAAFDLLDAAGDSATPPSVLFLAHRGELLDQAAATLGQMMRSRWPTTRVDFCAGASAGLDADLLLASIQKVANEPWLGRLAETRWDHVIVDEVHHATAPGYRRVLSRLSAGFVLGLTATPERMDEADLFGLFDDHLAYRADLDRGIGEGLLAPFSYFGLRDTTDFAPIPWRNGKFDAEGLAQAVQTEQRMEKLWEAWQAHPGTRTLVFCATIAHAEFASTWLSARGVRIAAVHSGPGSADRERALIRLRDGEVDALATVDLFNEGVDLPTIDRVAMLRPTESPIVFLQQLGRGLRKAPGKERVTVLDFVGNHRVFLDRIGRLVSLGSHGSKGLRAFLEGEAPSLPPGCSVNVELEAIDLLRGMLPMGRTELERTYRELRALRGERPELGELFRLGLSPQALRTSGRSWFELVRDEGDLDQKELAVLEACADWLRELETSAMSKSFKAIVVEVLLEQGAIGTGMELDALADACHAVMVRSPELMSDIEGVRELPDPRHPAPEAWRRYWRKNPIAAWTSGRFFALEVRAEGQHLVPRFAAPEGLEDTLVELTRELIDYRLAQYRRRSSSSGDEAGGTFEASVSWSRRDPVLSFAPGVGPGVGVTVVRVDGVPWDFRFTATGCAEAAPANIGRRRNQLPDLLRRWFGPTAGQPGGEAAGTVRFVRSPDAWWAEAVGMKVSDGAQVIDLATRRVRAYPTLRAAAGA
ncbi:MAG TPA: DEAD/DEAH box helicase family protein, partial [Myxococcota bacterium]|nr:DEAD/DEAH box helicase family protein [Myxococcota bacterium]